MPRFKTLIVILKITNILVSLVSATIIVAEDNNWQQLLEEAANQEMLDSGTPSIQLAIGKNGKLIYNNAFGLSDVENKVIATVDSKYRTASISKWFTASAALMLVEQGKLELDIPIQTYCPAFPEKQKPITARQLLSHTSGIRHYANYDSLIKNAKTESERNKIKLKQLRDQLGEFTHYTNRITPLDNFKDDTLKYEPGTEWLYSSFGYRVLACVMEGASKQTYNELQQQIFNIAGMNDTVADDAWAIIPNRVTGYRLIKGQPLRRSDLRDVSENLPAGGHLSTAADLVRFAEAFSSAKLVNRETMTLMSKPLNISNKPGREPSWRDAIPSEPYYSYGMMFFPNDENLWAGHDGQQEGASSILIFIPEQNLSIAVLTNIKGWRGYMSFTRKVSKIMETVVKSVK